MKSPIGRVVIFSLLIAAASGLAVAQDAGVKVSNSEAMKAATAKVQPEYPVIARQLHLEGKVEVEVHITEEGLVESAKPVTGNAVLANAAVAATRHWRFSPFMAGGKPVKATADLNFTFKL